MNTDTTKTDAKYTLISYRPNGERYEGCGEYVRFDSELDLSADLSRDEARAKIIEKLKHAEDCCDSCSHNENPTEFALLKDGKSIAARGDNLYSFTPEAETEDTLDGERIFEEAHEMLAKERAEKAEADRIAKEAAAKKAAEAKKAADEAARVAAEAAERKRFEELKAKFEPKFAVAS
jgi:hypothetical protein